VKQVQNTQTVQLTSSSFC